MTQVKEHPSVPETEVTRYDDADYPYDRLMVIIPHSLSGLVKKGEVIDRYYNPGNLFRQVHLVLANDDKPDVSFMRRMVGDAELHIHNVPTGPRFFLRTLAWRPFLVRRWAAKVSQVAAQVRPQLIRCHGAFYNAFAASEIKRRLGIPYVVSLHTNPDQSLGLSWPNRIQWRFLDGIARKALRDADLVMPVYEGIRPYVERLGAPRVDVAYNVVNPSAIVEKARYAIGENVRIVSVGRLVEGKSPERIIRAVAGLPTTTLKIIGDGPLHDHLQALTRREGVADRVEIIRSLPNDRLCRLLADCDVFAVCIEKWGISKVVLEAFLTGLPVIINRPDSMYVPEITSQIALLVDNTSEGYRAGLEKLILDGGLREFLGRAGQRRARENWDPTVTEANYVRIYREILAASGS